MSLGQSFVVFPLSSTSAKHLHLQIIIMRFFTKKINFLIGCFILLIFNQCSKPTGCVNDKALNYDPTIEVADGSCEFPSLSLDFVLKVGAFDFEINRIYNINGYNTAFKQFQFYISDLELERSDLTTNDYSTKYPLIKEANSSVPLGEVFVETFEKVRFNVGVDSATNSNIAAFLNNSMHDLFQQNPDTMHYNYSDGYIFLKMVGKVDRNGDNIPNENESFDMRIGTNQFLRSIELVVNKDVTEAQDKIELQVDIEKLLNGVDLQVEQHTNSMNDVPLATKIANNIPLAITAL